MTLTADGRDLAEKDVLCGGGGESKKKQKLKQFFLKTAPLLALNKIVQTSHIDDLLPWARCGVSGSVCPAVPSLLRAGPPGTSQMALWKGFLGPPVGSAGGRRVCRRPLSQLPTPASRGRLVDGAAGLPSAGASRCGVSRRRPLPGDSAVLSLSRGEDSAGGCEVACRCHRRIRCRSRLPARSLGPVLGAGEGEPLALRLTPGAARCGPGQASCVPPSPGLRNGRGTPLPGPWRVRGQAHRRVWERRLPSGPHVAPNGPASAHSRFGTHVFTFSPLGWDRASDDHEREAGHGGGDSLQVPGPEGGIRGVTPAPRRSRALLLASSSCSPLFPLACGRLTPDSVSQLPRLFRLGASQKDTRRRIWDPAKSSGRSSSRDLS